MNHQCVGGLIALGFGADYIKGVVSMTTNRPISIFSLAASEVSRAQRGFKKYIFLFLFIYFLLEVGRVGGGVGEEVASHTY